MSETKKFQTDITLQRRNDPEHRVTVILDEKSLKSAWGKYCHWKKCLKQAAYTASRRKRALNWRSDGVSVTTIATALKISVGSVYRILQEDN